MNGESISTIKKLITFIWGYVFIFTLIKNPLFKIIGKKNTYFPTGFSPWKMQFSFVSRSVRIYYTQKNPKHIKSTGFTATEHNQ